MMLLDVDERAGLRPGRTIIAALAAITVEVLAVDGDPLGARAGLRRRRRRQRHRALGAADGPRLLKAVLLEASGETPLPGRRRSR